MEKAIIGNNPAKSKTVISANNIFIKGARVHNLKNVTVEFPRNRLIVVTGVSGLRLQLTHFMPKGNDVMRKV